MGDILLTPMLVKSEPDASYFKSSPEDQQSKCSTSHDLKTRLNRHTVQDTENASLPYGPSYC